MNQSEMKRYLEIGGLLNLLVGIAATIWFMFQNGEPDSFTWYLIALPFLLWTTLPFAAVFLMIKKTADVFHADVIFFITSAIISFGGIWILYDAFNVNLDPQGGLIFLFLPVLQLIIVSISFALVTFLNWLFKIR